MKLRKIKIENLGKTKDFELGVAQDTVVFVQEDYEDILLGLSRGASNRLFYEILEERKIETDTRVVCDFECEGDFWQVESVYNDGYAKTTREGRTVVEGQKLKERYYRNGEEIELGEYYGKFHIPVDENARFWFAGGRRINGEKDGRRPSWITDFDFENFFVSRVANNDYFAKGYLKGFVPRPINVDKDLYLSFDENYRFIPVVIQEGEERPFEGLSESEELIFRYLCFLEVNNFCFAENAARGLDCAKKPLFIFNFLEYLDEGVNVAELLRRATVLGCQVFIFTGGHTVNTKGLNVQVVGVKPRARSYRLTQNSSMPSKKLAGALMQFLTDYNKRKRKRKKLDEPIFLCVGTDLAAMDTLAPLCGTLLKERMPDAIVFGQFGALVTAQNVQEIGMMLKKEYSTHPIIAIDAAVTDCEEEIGNILIIDEPLKPGSGVKKNLGEVGDFTIQGITCSKLFLDKPIRIGDIYNTAMTICKGLRIFLKKWRDDYGRTDTEQASRD